MIRIECDVCGTQSDNVFTFDNARFTYCNANDILKGVHLCRKCQTRLQRIIDTTIAQFLDVEKVRDWHKSEGVT